MLGQFTVSFFEQAAALRRQKRYAEAAGALASLIECGSKLGTLAIDNTSLFGRSMTMAAARLPVPCSKL